MVPNTEWVHNFEPKSSFLKSKNQCSATDRWCLLNTSWHISIALTAYVIDGQFFSQGNDSYQYPCLLPLGLLLQELDPPTPRLVVVARSFLQNQPCLAGSRRWWINASASLAVTTVSHSVPDRMGPQAPRGNHTWKRSALSSVSLLHTYLLKASKGPFKNKPSSPNPCLRIWFTENSN